MQQNGGKETVLCVCVCVCVCVYISRCVYFCPNTVPVTAATLSKSASVSFFFIPASV